MATVDFGTRTIKDCFQATRSCPEHKDKLNSLVMDRAILIAVDFSICAEIHQAISFGDV